MNARDRLAIGLLVGGTAALGLAGDLLDGLWLAAAAVGVVALVVGFLVAFGDTAEPAAPAAPAVRAPGAEVRQIRRHRVGGE